MAGPAEGALIIATQMSYTLSCGRGAFLIALRPASTDICVLGSKRRGYRLHFMYIYPLVIWALRGLVWVDASANRVATVYTNAPKRLREAISTDLCTLLRPHGRSQQRNSPTVYTNAPIRRGEARSSHLCTLLRSQGHPQPKPTAQQCTQVPQNGAERPF